MANSSSNGLIVTTLKPTPSQTPSNSPAAVPNVVINFQPASPSENEASSILSGVAAILWPLVLALIVILFRTEIIALLRRLKKGSAFGAEAEFEQDLAILNREAEKARTEEVPEEDGETVAPQGPSSDSIRDTILAEAARSPRLGLMLLSAEIEKLARRTAAATGHKVRSSLRDQLEVWSSLLPQHTSAAYRLFWRISRRIVHGAETTDQEILSALDSGLTLYEALISLPIEQNVVLHPGVDIFSDPTALTKLEAKGLVIQTTHNGEVSRRIYPTTKTHYVPGMRLTWEWNLDRVWGPAWYRDLDTGEIVEAWRSSAEFIGQDLDTI